MGFRDNKMHPTIRRFGGYHSVEALLKKAELNQANWVSIVEGDVQFDVAIALTTPVIPSNYVHINKLKKVFEKEAKPKLNERHLFDSFNLEEIEAIINDNPCPDELNTYDVSLKAYYKKQVLKSENGETEHYYRLSNQDELSVFGLPEDHVMFKNIHEIGVWCVSLPKITKMLKTAKKKQDTTVLIEEPKIYNLAMYKPKSKKLAKIYTNDMTYAEARSRLQTTKKQKLGACLCIINTNKPHNYF